MNDPSIETGRRELAECPGGSEYGHGLTMRRVHAGGCCERWEAQRASSPAVLETRERAVREYMNDARLHYAVDAVFGALDVRPTGADLARVAAILVGLRDGEAPQ